MIKGIKTLADGDYCAYCNVKVNLDIYNFCPKCGNPLNENAIKLREQQDDCVKMNVIDELSQKINDKESLQVLADYLKK